MSFFGLLFLNSHFIKSHAIFSGNLQLSVKLSGGHIVALPCFQNWYFFCSIHLSWEGIKYNNHTLIGESSKWFFSIYNIITGFLWIITEISLLSMVTYVCQCGGTAVSTIMWEVCIYLLAWVISCAVNFSTAQDPPRMVLFYFFVGLWCVCVCMFFFFAEGID